MVVARLSAQQTALLAGIRADGEKISVHLPLRGQRWLEASVPSVDSARNIFPQLPVELQRVTTLPAPTAQF